MKDFAGRTAFVTGGANGVGIGLVRALLAEGCKVAIADVRQDAIDRALKSLDNREVMGVQLDVSSRADFAAAADEVEQRFGPVSIICNNAGVNLFQPIEESSYDDWDWLLGVNLHGVINGVQTFVPRMVERVKAGTQVGGAWACPGTFPRGNAVKQCAAKFSVCKTADSVDLSACNALDGFFVSDALGYSGFPACRNVDPIFFQCTAFQPGMDNRLRFGCGGLAKPYALTNCTSQCAGFDRALNCSQEVDYTCGASLGLADEANLLPSSGVLCCPG